MSRPAIQPPSLQNHDETAHLRERLYERNLSSEEYMERLMAFHMPPARVEAMRREAEAEEQRVAEEKRIAELQQARCTLCNNPVPLDLAEECLEVPRKPFRQQAAFCDKHSKFEAHQQWESLGYPIINWESLHERIVGLYPEIRATITGERWSAFENLMDEMCCASGDGASSHKRMRLTAMNDSMMRRASVGYYGPRGAAML